MTRDDGDGVAWGGAIYNTGALTVTNSLIYGNQATNAAYRNGGAIYHNGSTLLISGVPLSPPSISPAHSPVGQVVPP